MTPTPEQDAALLEELAESGLVKSYNDDLRAAAALIRDLAAREARLREALKKIEPLARQLNSASEINTEWGRVVVGQAQAARDLYAIVEALGDAP